MAERLSYSVINQITNSLIVSKRGVEISKNIFFHLETCRLHFRCHKLDYYEIYLFNTEYKCKFSSAFMRFSTCVLQNVKGLCRCLSGYTRALALTPDRAQHCIPL